MNATLQEAIMKPVLYFYIAVSSQERMQQCSLAIHRRFSEQYDCKFIAEYNGAHIIVTDDPFICHLTKNTAHLRIYFLWKLNQTTIPNSGDPDRFQIVRDSSSKEYLIEDVIADKLFEMLVITPIQDMNMEETMSIEKKRR